MNRLLPLTAFALALAPVARAAEHITLRNGFEFDCARREPAGDPANARVRLYLLAAPGDLEGTANYLEVPVASIVQSQTIPDPIPAAHEAGSWVEAAAPLTAGARSAARSLAGPSPVELRELLTKAGSAHNIDADLLASVVHAESGGNSRAVSHAGAQGLMQLMPGTALELGVTEPFAAEQNITGGSTYLDQLLTRYHDNIAFALAAYNAGPLAVDRYHGIPPYPETRAYVARVIREFNRRKLAAK